MPYRGADGRHHSRFQVAPMSEPKDGPANAKQDKATTRVQASGPRLFRIARGLLVGDLGYRARLRKVLAPSIGALRRRVVALAKITRFWSKAKADCLFISGPSHTPGHAYRVERYAEAARASGARPKILRIEDCRGTLREFASARVVVIWRVPWSDKVALIVDAARSVGASVVFDIDDLIFVPELARASVIDEIRSQGLEEETLADSFAEMRRALIAADLCTATTDELAQHARRAGIPTLVHPNGFDDASFSASRAAARHWIKRRSDALLRIGYAAGSRTHQRDFAACAGAVASILRERANVRLVLFREGSPMQPMLDLQEYPEFEGVEDRVEWRDSVPLHRLPEEIARFDVNLAPLEIGNPFCEAKSELKYFEAALAGVCTIASATGPFSRAMRQGETGFLAETAEQWHDALEALLDDHGLRQRMASAALHDVLWAFGPDRRSELMASMLSMLRGGRDAAAIFAWGLQAEPCSRQAQMPSYRRLFESDRLGAADVTIIVPVFNYAQVVEEALDSVFRQTLAGIDLIVIDDASTDGSAAILTRWAKTHASGFNRLLVLQNCVNAGLGHTRNLGFGEADTLYVLPLDADNRLLPQCAERCLETIRAARAAFAYPVIRQFGDSDGVAGGRRYDPLTLTLGNYIDAMALISKASWAAVGGYENFFGWEDYDFWCKLAERGLFGTSVGGEPLAEYRVHSKSMLRTVTEVIENKRRLVEDMSARHPWVKPDSGLVAAPGAKAG